MIPTCSPLFVCASALPTCQYLVYWSPESLRVCPSLQHNWYLETTSKSERWEEQLKLDSKLSRILWQLTADWSIGNKDFIAKAARQQKYIRAKYQHKNEILICSAMNLLTLSVCLHTSSQCLHPKGIKTKHYGEDALPFPFPAYMYLIKKPKQEPKA